MFCWSLWWPKDEDKHKTWTLVRHLFEETNLPILFGGDFNEILSYNEKEGGVDKTCPALQAFRYIVDDLSLCDLGYMGKCFTWERGKTVETRIRERVDRFLGSLSWLAFFPSGGAFDSQQIRPLPHSYSLPSVSMSKSSEEAQGVQV